MHLGVKGTKVKKNFITFSISYKNYFDKLLDYKTAFPPLCDDVSLNASNLILSFSSEEFYLRLKKNYFDIINSITIIDISERVKRIINKYVFLLLPEIMKQFMFPLTNCIFNKFQKCQRKD